MNFQDLYESGKTIVVATHDSALEALATRTLRL